MAKLTPAERQARQQALEQAREETARRAQQEAEVALTQLSLFEGCEGPK